MTTLNELMQRLGPVLEDYPERIEVLLWMAQEWSAYAGEKFGTVEQRQAEGHDADMKAKGFSEGAFFVGQITNYWSRAALYGVAEHSPHPMAGRQAAMKTATTLVDALACMMRVHGKPPAPGHPSGELKEWIVDDQ